MASIYRVVFGTEWSREMLLEAWMEDPVQCCEKCGVQPPNSLILEAQHRRQQEFGTISTKEEKCQEGAPLVSDHRYLESVFQFRRQVHKHK